YQSPQDVAEALAPHCQPLTQVSLREASLASIGAESFASEEKFELKNEPADLEYNRFLREMQSGAEVDLLFSGSSGDVAFSPADQMRPEESTAPALRNVEPRAARVRKRPPVRRGHRLAIWLVSGTAALLIGVLMLLAALRSDAPMPSSNGVNSGQTGPEKLPAAVIQEAADLQVVAGAEFIHEPRIVWEAGSPPATEIIFQLGNQAPADCQVDPRSGRIRWPVSELQTPATYSIPLRLILQATDKDHVLATADLKVQVQAAPPASRFPVFVPVRLSPGRPFDAPLALDGDAAIADDCQYEILEGRQEGMQLDPRTGRFQWTPTDDQIGRHDIVVGVVGGPERRTLTQQQVRLTVRPGPLRIDMPVFDPQEAVAGTRFELAINPRLFNGLPR
ncbi:MAG: hypothetical protein KDA85_12630, partial [Planctomycetaceae bacterium]|nr:hypothetical protein [Planctomycetaceae bacterium]